MEKELEAIQSMTTGKIYVVHKELSKKEAELVEKKIQELAETEKGFESLDKELAKIGTKEDRESLTRKTGIYQKKLDLIEASKRIQAELEEMLSSTLQHCFNLTIAQIDTMDMNERRQIFLKLADACK